MVDYWDRRKIWTWGINGWDIYRSTKFEEKTPDRSGKKVPKATQNSEKKSIDLGSKFSVSKRK